MRSWRGSPGKQRLSAFLKVPTPRSLGYPASWLSLATGPRPLPPNHSGIHPLRAFPRLRKLREAPIWSLEPSRGPTAPREAPQPSHLRAGMTDKGTPQ